MTESANEIRFTITLSEDDPTTEEIRRYMNSAGSRVPRSKIGMYLMQVGIATILARRGEPYADKPVFFSAPTVAQVVQHGDQDGGSQKRSPTRRRRAARKSGGPDSPTAAPNQETAAPQEAELPPVDPKAKSLLAAVGGMGI